jgi:hypothetical protein
LQEFHEQGDPFTAPAGMVLQNAGDISAATDFDRSRTPPPRGRLRGVAIRKQAPGFRPLDCIRLRSRSGFGG